MPQFRAEIADHIKRQYGVSTSIDNIMVGAGSKILSYYICQTFLKCGDSILLHEPSWVSYREHAKLCGAKTKYIDAKENVSSAAEILQKDPSIKIIYVNNPNNPRGYVYQESEIRHLAETTKKFGVVLVIDESYSDFVQQRVCNRH